ncbi:Alpha/Beta hydrolase protein [Mycena sanguinolenta]|nr:Alpha/Beta hydrolase protein [Mycena sanguinolenta]
MRALVTNTRLPVPHLYPNAGFDKGIGLDFLRELQSEWVGSFDWKSQEAELNRFDHYTAEIEGQTFAPVIKPLTQSWTSPTGESVSYDVVVPSLPGFVFSSAPPANWTVDDTARMFNTLMTDVLGYSAYALHGTDWACIRGSSAFFNATVRAAHFVVLPVFPPSAHEIAAMNITLSAQQNVTEKRYTDFITNGMACFSSRPTSPMKSEWLYTTIPLANLRGWAHSGMSVQCLPFFLA